MRHKSERRLSPKYRSMMRSAVRNLKHDTISRTDLAKRVVRRAKMLGLSQTAVAKLSNDAASQMSRLFNGHYGIFSVERLAGILVKLGCSIDVYVTEHRSMRPRRARILTG